MFWAIINYRIYRRPAIRSRNEMLVQYLLGRN